MAGLFWHCSKVANSFLMRNVRSGRNIELCCKQNAKGDESEIISPQDEN